MTPNKKRILKILGAVYLALIVLYFVNAFYLTGPSGGAMRTLDHSLAANDAVLKAPLQLTGELELTQPVVEALLESHVTAIAGQDQPPVLLGAVATAQSGPQQRIINEAAIGRTVQNPILPAGTHLREHLWARILLDSDEQPAMYDAANPPMVEVSGIAGIMQFDMTLVFIIANFLGLFILLYLALWDPIMSMLDTRAETIRNDLDAAAGRRREADGLKKQYGELMLSAKQERQEMVQQGRREGETERERIVAEARDESARIVEQTRQELESEAGKARTALRREIGGLSLEIAEKILGREVKSGDNDRLVADFLSKVQQSDAGAN